MKITDKTPQVGLVSPTPPARPEAPDEAPGESTLASVVDRVDLSEEGIQRALIDKVRQSATDSPEIDWEKVAVLKKAIAEGAYQPDSSKVAEKMLEEMIDFSRL
ncbi:MAG: flagellar biosynthesis anti-sigma factor FlgM [Myxococcales bacterium]|nr:MAG: flagellar biosynthesis anti-sigma factor FlgM [Myxococcales bacterium]